MISRDEYIVEVWAQTRKEIVGASELGLIQEALAKRFGAEVSPASIARVLADHGARLGHPEILQADVRWRERQRSFTPDDLAFDTIDSALALIGKIQQAHDRQSVLQLKNELDLLAAAPTAPPNRRAVAREVAQWLTIWLQNPGIFNEWLDLRRATDEFRHQFGL
jgi:hypothetical protein